MNKARRAALNAIVNALTELKNDLDILRDEEQDAFDNLPESMQESERGEAIQEAADNLSDAFDSLEDAIDSIETAME